METTQLCPKCGRVIAQGLRGVEELRGPEGAQAAGGQPQGRIVCRCSARPRRYWLHSRETILMLCVAGLIVAFAITGFAARLYHGRRAELARYWFDRGNAELQAGRPQAALSDFRDALVYAEHEFSPEQQQQYELNFVQALVATGNTGEAQSYLLDMWERAPGNSKVNVELARMAARAGDDADAKRYYNEAIYGVWDEKAGDILRSRMETRLELYHYLMDREEKTEAQSILLAIAAATPPDATAHAQVGELMLEAGQRQQALDEFQQALRLDGRNYEALAGAGEANFQLGIDREAVRYLESATRDEVQQKRKPGAPDADSAGRQEEAARVAQELAIAQATLALDPNRPGLDALERARRAIRAYDAAVTRIESCAREHGVALPDPSANLTPFTDATSDELAQASLARHIDQLQPLLEFVFQMESSATENCGAPSDAANAALVRIGERAQTARP